MTDADQADADVESDQEVTEDADLSTNGEADLDDHPDGSGPTCGEMSDRCASEFGSLFFRSNGRADGTLLALVEPTDTQCPLYNDTHVVLQLLIQGQVQRLVASVDGVGIATATAPLIGPAFEEGWHPDVDLDYPTDLGVHSEDFAQSTMEGAVSFICSELELDAPLSVFAYSDDDYPSSAHQIHRNDRYPDGAIVARPTSGSPTYLLFRYADQTF